MANKKEKVALVSMVASALMTLGKLAAGVATGSLGLISEAVHSLLDFVSTLMTYMAVRVSDRPADEQHNYGHGKIESIAALGETFLLFVTSFWIIYEAARRLITNDVEIEPNWWAAAVVVVCIVVDISRAMALKKVAIETKSQALEADALHFSSDVYSSIVVLIGLGVAALGWPSGDAIAAIGVSMFVCLAGWRLGRRTVDALIDTAPEGITARVRDAAASVPDVIAVDRARARQVGHITFVDLDIAVGRGLPLGRVDAMREAVIQQMKETVDSNVEVNIAVHPLTLDDESVNQRVANIAANFGASVHHIMSHRINGVLSISCDFEVGLDKKLGEAHIQATEFENAIREELGDDIEVETRIEPHQLENVLGTEVNPAMVEEFARLARAETRGLDLIKEIHHVRARMTEYGLILIFHCLIDSECSIIRAYAAVEELESRIRNSCPNAWRVVGHAEPLEH